MAKHFGTSVRARRKALKWTQKALAAQVGCTDAYISEIENQRKEPGEELRSKLIEVLDLRDIPTEASDQNKIIALSPAVHPTFAPIHTMEAPERPEPDPDLYRSAVAEALSTAAIEGWRPQTRPEEPSALALSAARLIGEAGHGMLAQAFFSQPDPGPGPWASWALLKLPMPEGLRISNAGLEREFYLRRTLPDLVGFGPPPALAYLPAQCFPPRVSSRFEMPAQVAVLVFPIDAPSDTLWATPPQTLAEHPLMKRGVKSARDLLDWCTIARALIGLTLGLQGAGWGHRDLTPRNILIRCDRGLVRDLRAIAFGAATPVGRPCAPYVQAPELWHWHPERISAWGFETQRGSRRWKSDPRAEDLYALGTVLGHLLVGSSERHQPPARHGDPEQRSWRVYRAQQIGDDLRFHIDEGRKHPERLPETLRPALWSLYQLSHELIEHAHTLSTETLFKHLGAVEGASTDALALLTHQNTPQPKAQGPGPKAPQTPTTLLQAMLSCVTLDETSAWCSRYTERDAEATKTRIKPFPWIVKSLQRLDTPLPPEAMDVDRALLDCLELVRLGFVRLGLDTLSALLMLGPTEDPDRDIRMLRVAVGGLLLREPDFETVRTLLSRFDMDGAPEEQLIDHMGHRRWWVELLKARLALMEGHTEVAALTLERLPQPDPELFPRAWIAALSVEALHALRTRQPIGDLRHRLVMARRWTTSTPESLLLATLLARCDATEGNLQGALSRLRVGLGEAAAREFPVECGVMMSLAARLIRDHLQDPRRTRFAHDDEHPESLLLLAERLALKASNLFGALTLSARLQQALIVAGDCARMRGDDDAAISHYGLARANASLGAHTPPHLRAEVESRFAQLIESPDTHDSGSRIAEDHYNRRGAISLALWGGERLSFEAHDPGQPLLGRMLGGLVETFVPQIPQVILDLGCGVGADSRALALRFPEARVIGADIAPWCVREARRRHVIAPGRLAFHRISPEALRQGQLNFGQPDLVILRDTLRQVAARGPFLKALRETLAPGAVILILDTVQTRPCAPDLSQKLCAALRAVHLETALSLNTSLREAGFEPLTPNPQVHSDALQAFLQSRLDWVVLGRDREARRVNERQGESARIRGELEVLIDAYGQQNMLDQVAVAARAR